MKCFLASSLLLALALPVYAGDVKLQVANGRITLRARDATVREILAEWARVGQVKIVNGEKVSSTPITLDLQGVPEAQALNTLLRSVSGYMAAPKAQVASGTSIYDRIIIMATPRAPATTTNYAPTPTPPQQTPYRPGMPPGMSNPGILDDEDPAGAPPNYQGVQQGYPAGPRAAIVAPGQQQQPVQAPAAGAIPTGAPGTMSPVAGVPGQPGTVMQPTTGAPGTISQPVKKPGGPGGSGPG